MPLSKGTGLVIPWLKPKIAKAKEVITQWLELCDYQVYCSVSGGKDSIVTSHLIATVFPDCPMVWVNKGQFGNLGDWAESIEIVRKTPNAVELCPIISRFTVHRQRENFNQVTKAANKSTIFYEPLAQWQEINNIKGAAMGLRAQESRGRLESLKYRGLIYPARGLTYCCPIGWWKTQEVWHYINMFELEYPSQYDLDPNTRNGSAIGTKGANWGRVAQLKHDFPDVYQELISEFPCYRDFS